tara:strand:+ start:52081 stop:53058 length:978 start_codon:yes stop_codon:yes gene_type:complete
MEKNITNTPQPTRLDKWIKSEFPGIPHSLISKLLRKKKILVNGAHAEGKTRVQDGDQVVINGEIQAAEPQPKRTYIPTSHELEEFKRSIVSQTPNYIIINKPSGLASQGGSKLTKHLDGLIHALGEEDGNSYHLVHRLDKETSGTMIIARNKPAAQKLGQQFKAREVTKIYIAITQGVPEVSEGRIDVPLSKKWFDGYEKVIEDQEGDKALTFYKVIDKIGQSAALVALMPITGRNHQLRVHMALMGCPIIGDKKYNEEEQSVMDELPNKLHLHSYKLILGDTENKSNTYKTDLPDYYKKTLKMLGFDVPSMEMDEIILFLQEQK